MSDEHESRPKCHCRALISFISAMSGRARQRDAAQPDCRDRLCVLLGLLYGILACTGIQHVGPQLVRGGGFDMASVP